MKQLSLLPVLFCLLQGALVTVHADSSGAVRDGDPPVPSITHGKLQRPSNAVVRVALLDSGVNYQLPLIYQRLARDSRGELIGYDFWDMDRRPFDSHPDSRGTVQRHGTRTASLLLAEAPFVELVPYRYPRPDMARMWPLVEHANHHGVRIMGMPLGSNKPEQWQAFEQAALAHPHMLFVASAGNNGRDIDKQPVYPASFTLDNLLVVTSADDFARPARGSNWGRVSVDYLVPAEYQEVTRFDGSVGRVSGSSYAVPRVLAMAARLLRDEPALDAAGIKSRLRQYFASGTWPRHVAEGFIHDPQFDQQHEIRILQQDTLHLEKPVGKHGQGQESVQSTQESHPQATLALEVLILDNPWRDDQVLAMLTEAQSILAQCQLGFEPIVRKRLQVPDYLKDLHSGSARTLFDAARASGPARKLTVVLARDSRMSTSFEAEAFGAGNTRHRPWLDGSVWLTLDLRDRAIALAHELFHVLVNSGEHSQSAGNLMLARTTGSNTRLTSTQCKEAHRSARHLGWL